MKLEIIRAKCVDEVRVEAKLRAICPVSNTVDNYRAIIEYTPQGDEECTYIELRSLRDYLNGFENVKIYHEDLANTLLENLAEALKPKYLKITLKSIYLGMEITIYKTYDRNLVPLVH